MQMILNFYNLLFINNLYLIKKLKIQNIPKFQRQLMIK